MAVLLFQPGVRELRQQLLATVAARQRRSRLFRIDQLALCLFPGLSPSGTGRKGDLPQPKRLPVHRLQIIDSGLLRPGGQRLSQQVPLRLLAVRPRKHPDGLPQTPPGGVGLFDPGNHPPGRSLYHRVPRPVRLLPVDKELSGRYILPRLDRREAALQFNGDHLPSRGGVQRPGLGRLLHRLDLAVGVLQHQPPVQEIQADPALGIQLAGQRLLGGAQLLLAQPCAFPDPLFRQRQAESLRLLRFQGGKVNAPYISRQNQLQHKEQDQPGDQPGAAGNALQPAAGPRPIHQFRGPSALPGQALEPGPLMAADPGLIAVPGAVDAGKMDAGAYRGRQQAAGAGAADSDIQPVGCHYVFAPHTSIPFHFPANSMRWI